MNGEGDFYSFLNVLYDVNRHEVTLVARINENLPPKVIKEVLEPLSQLAGITEPLNKLLTVSD